MVSDPAAGCAPWMSAALMIYSITQSRATTAESQGWRSSLRSLSLGLRIEELARGHDAGATEPHEPQQMAITRDNRIGTAASAHSRIRLSASSSRTRWHRLGGMDDDSEAAN
jgi:hypothetical protein